MSIKPTTPEPTLAEQMQSLEAKLDEAQSVADRIAKRWTVIGGAGVSIFSVTGWWKSIMDSGGLSIHLPAQLLWLVVLLGSNGFIYWVMNKQRFRWREYHKKEWHDFWNRGNSFVPEWRQGSMYSNGTLHLSLRVTNRSPLPWSIDAVDIPPSAVKIDGHHVSLERGKITSMTIEPYQEWVQSFTAKAAPTTERYVSVTIDRCNIFIRDLGGGKAEPVAMESATVICSVG